MLREVVSVSRARLWRWLLLPASALLSGCRFPGRDGFLHPDGPVAAEDRTLIILTVALMLIVVVPVLVLTPLLAWRYRRGNAEADYQPRWDFSRKLEILVWGVPALIVLAIGWFAWTQSHALDPYRPLPGAQAPLEVQVVGLDWKWLFIYPEQGIASVNELVIPAGRPVRLDLTSDTVMLSLLVPKLAGQIYAMAGMRTQLNLLADRPGTFLGENTQYNGEGFQDQRFPVEAVSAAGFATWVGQVRAGGEALDAARYARLSAPSVMPGHERFASVEDGLFYRVIARYCPECAERLRRQDRARDEESDGRAHDDGSAE